MRLPGIDYDRQVQPLTKQGTDEIERRTKIEVDLSKARLGAELDKASAIGQANIRLARERRKVESESINQQVKIATDRFAFNSQQDANRDILVAGVVGNLAQTMISVGSDWYAAREEAKAATAITSYQSGLAGLTSELSNSPTINLDQYPDVDFSSVPENMIYEGTDALTGKAIRSVPNHVGAPLVFAQREKGLRESAGLDIKSDITRSQFENGIDRARATATAKIVGVTSDYEHSFLKGQYIDAVEKAVQNEDLPTAVDIINSAEARGVLTLEEASKRRGELTGDIKFSSLIRRADEAKTLADIQALREEGYDMPKSEMISFRAVLAQKENEIERAIEKAQTTQKRITMQRNVEQAMNVGLATKGTFEDQRAAVVEYATRVDPENVDTYTTNFRVRYNQQKNVENARVAELADATAEQIWRDPSTVIPGDITGETYIKLEKLRQQVASGVAPVTNAKRWNELYTMMVEEPEKFKKLPLGPEMVNLDEADFKWFKAQQAESQAGGGYKGSQVVSANAQFEDFATTAFGKNYDKKKDAAGTVNTARIEYVKRVDALERDLQRQATASERTDILVDIFKRKTSSYSRGLLGGLREKDVTLLDDDIIPYVNVISDMLRAKGYNPTSSRIISEYNAWLKAGRLEELE